MAFRAKNPIDLAGITDGQTVVYDSATGLLVPADAGGGMDLIATATADGTDDELTVEWDQAVYPIALITAEITLASSANMRGALKRASDGTYPFNVASSYKSAVDSSGSAGNYTNESSLIFAPATDNATLWKVSAIITANGMSFVSRRPAGINKGWVTLAWDEEVDGGFKIHGNTILIVSGSTISVHGTPVS